MDLSKSVQAEFAFEPDGLALAASVTSAAFETWIEEDLREIDEVLSGVLARAAVGEGDVDRVFATGGSSFVPAVRRRLAARFGADRVVGGEELTSVASGLAAAARARFMS